MRLYRISKKQYINDLSGKGAELAGGRWNSKGVPAIYASSSLALCICEVLVHTDKDILPDNMYFAEIYIPDECVSSVFFSQEALKNSLSNGSQWLSEKGSVAIKVQSAIMPENYTADFDIVINPLHPDFHSVRIEKIEPCPFDVRLF